MKKIISGLFVLIFLLNGIFAFDYYYDIDLSQNKIGLYLKRVDVKIGEMPDEKFFGDSSLKIVSFDSTILGEVYFRTYDYLIVEDFGQGAFSEKVYFPEIKIVAPYYENAKEIIIYDENLTEKLKIDVSMFAKETGAKIKDGENQTVQEKRQETQRGTENLVGWLEKNWWILAGILIILLVIAFVLFKKKNE